VGWTKQQIVEEAFGELALHGFVVDLDPDTLQSGLRRLDTMMAMWDGKGIRLGYPLPSSPDDSNLDDDSNLPDMAVEPVYLNLAVRLSAGYGKQVSPTTAATAKEGYDMLMARAAMPPEVNFPRRMPAGAGNLPWRRNYNPFLIPPDEPINAGPDGGIDFN
jgi:hypothetical protein